MFAVMPLPMFVLVVLKELCTQILAMPQDLLVRDNCENRGWECDKFQDPGIRG